MWRCLKKIAELNLYEEKWMKSCEELTVKVKRTNGTYSFLVLCIDILMIVSMNNIIRIDTLLGTLFLFAISYLGAFLEKNVCCAKCSSCDVEGNQKYSAWLNNLGLYISMVLVVICITAFLGIIEINIVDDESKWPIASEIQVQSTEKAYFSFGTINIKEIISLFIFSPFVIHSVSWLLDVLDNKQMDVGKAFENIRKNKKYHCISGILAVLFFFIGIGICFLKFHFLKSQYGTAQWLKYGIIFAGSFMLLAEGGFLMHSLLKSRKLAHYMDLKGE